MKYTKEQQRKNLRKLADFLINVPDDKFDMTDYESECGTVACACGYGPEAGIRKLEDEDWAYYSKRVFGFYHNYEWLWCFGAPWQKVDNTPKGAAKRINYLLDNGLPEDWKSQICCTVPLCYV